MKQEIIMNEENRVYAFVLEVVCWFAFAVIIVLFILYVSGIIKPFISFDQLPVVWKLGVDGVIREYNKPVGWNWLLYLTKSDYLCYIGLTVLISATIAALTAVLAVFIKKKNLIFTGIVLLQIVVLLAGASGVFAGGH